MKTDQTQDQKCPAGGDKDNTEGYPGFKDAIPMLYKTMLDALTESMSEAEKKEFLRESAIENSHLFHVVQSSFIAGVHYALGVPPFVAINEFQLWRMSQNPHVAEMLAKMKKALEERPDDVEDPNVK